LNVESAIESTDKLFDLNTRFSKGSCLMSVLQSQGNRLLENEILKKSFTVNQNNIKYLELCLIRLS
jgi:hypothetical protein